MLSPSSALQWNVVRATFAQLTFHLDARLIEGLAAPSARLAGRQNCVEAASSVRSMRRNADAKRLREGRRSEGRLRGAAHFAAQGSHSLEKRRGAPRTLIFHANGIPQPGRIRINAQHPDRSILALQDLHDPFGPLSFH
jgi:hypothetical protein